jgi:hypothetical protein
MSLVEWLLESTNPGPIGKVGLNRKPNDNGKPSKKWLVYVAVLIGVILAGIGLYLILHSYAHVGVGIVIVRLCFFALYVIVSHLFTATPERTNMGWLGGLVDNPFRISDDFNRLILLLQILLLPGKLIALALIIGWILIRYLCKALF